ncbi:hypothetical protein [Xanthovirga aplysinae]|uniref:hypothetical protein n=1 Tax=Xanthovirga aplysinae TaxID=2529853 RepID=UPI0012BC3B7E|nr:hypothetical protein [Xanthovirga aplysinae]MTI32680.1 hypothetical protein [Xanthovirga aplysinae]
MKSFIVGTLLLLSIFCIQSCGSRTALEDVDLFYTNKNYGQFFLTPLIKPIKLRGDYGIWYLETPHSFNYRISIDSLIEIGVDKECVYGKINQKKWYIKDYSNKDFVYARKDGGTITLKEKRDSKGEPRLFPIDSVSNTFLLPERWFVLNAKDSSTEVFFDEKNYKEYLNKKGLSGKMYKIDSLHKEFKKTGVLEYFPDSIKTKLRK